MSTTKRHPVPERAPQKPREWYVARFGIADLAAGDSIFIPGVNPTAAYQAAWKWARDNAPDRRFVARKAEHAGVMGSRVWRVHERA